MSEGRAATLMFWIVWSVAIIAFFFSPIIPIGLIGLVSGSFFGVTGGLALLICLALIACAALAGGRRLYREAYVMLIAGGLFAASGYALASQLK